MISTTKSPSHFNPQQKKSLQQQQQQHQQHAQLSRYMLSFESKKLTEAYTESASNRLKESKERSLLLNLSMKFILSFLILLEAESDTSMKLLCALSLLCLVVILFAQIFTNSNVLSIAAEFVSFACTEFIFLRTSSPNHEEFSKSFSSSNECGYLAGISSLLWLVGSGNSPVQKAIVTLVFAILFGVKYEFSLVSWLACACILAHVAYGLHGEERHSREIFLHSEQKKRSLKAWEKFLDRYVSEPVFVIEQNEKYELLQSVAAASSTKGKQREHLINKTNRIKDRINQSVSAAAAAAVSVASGGGSPTNSHSKHKLSLPVNAAHVNPTLPTGQTNDLIAKKRQNDISEQRPELFIADFGSEQKMILGDNSKANAHEQSQFFMNGRSAMSPPSVTGTATAAAAVPTPASAGIEQNQIKSTSSIGTATGMSPLQPNVIFQNLGCQQHFYSQVNQTSHFVSQLKSIYVNTHSAMLGAGENLLLSGALNNIQGGSAMLNSVAAAVSAVAAAGGGPMGTTEGQLQQQMLSSSKGKVPLIDYLQMKLVEVFGDRASKKRKQRLLSKKRSPKEDGQAGEASDEWSRERNYSGSDAFDVTELEVIENCERIAFTGFNMMTRQLYSVHILKVLFHGKQGLMVCLKETTNQRIAADIQITNAHTEKLLKSMLRQAVAPLQRIVNSVDSNSELVASAVRSWCVQSSSVVDDIVDYWTMLNGSRVELRKETASLASIVQEVVCLYEEDMFVRELEFACAWEKDDLEFVHTDAHRFKRVLSNLLALTLNHTLHSPIQLSFSYYDTHKQTILVVISHANSFLSDQVIELLTSQHSKSHLQSLYNTQQSQQKSSSPPIPQSKQHVKQFHFDDDGTQAYKLPPGMILQLLLCVELIERLGPSGSLSVRKDDEKCVEISFKIFSNLPMQPGVVDYSNANNGGENVSKHGKHSIANDSNGPHFISFNRQNENDNQFIVAGSGGEQGQLNQQPPQMRSQTRLYSMSMIKRGSRISVIAAAGGHDFVHSPIVNQSETMSLRNILSPAFFVGMSPPSQANTMLHLPSIVQIPPPPLLTAPSALNQQQQQHQQQQQQNNQSEFTVVSNGMINSIQRLESACLLTDDIMEKCDDKRAQQGGLRDIVRMSKQDVDLNLPIGSAARAAATSLGAGLAKAQGHCNYSSGSNNNSNTNMRFGGSTLTILNEKFESELANELDAQLSKQSILLVDSDAQNLNVLQKFKSVEMQVVPDLSAALTKIIGRHHHAAQNSSAIDLPFGRSMLPFYKLILVNIDSYGVMLQHQQQQHNHHSAQPNESEKPSSKTNAVNDVKRVAMYLRNVLDRNTPILLMSSASAVKEVEELQPQIFFLQMPLTIDKLAKILKISGSMLSTQAHSLPSLLMQ